MPIQFSPAVRNARLDQIETTIGTTPTLEVRSGAPPATTATADSGTLLASMTLPSDWMAAATGGAKAKLGTWQDTSADASGTPGHFRIKAGATTHLQGTAGVGSGDLSFDASISLGGTVTVGTFTLTDGNA
jgi:hypothetical protein